ncbi:MAG: bifunctional phosphopantothenoylcysteine decarboxylase/phosphopantothenate--cysteine ligase CoaBC [Candidatus Eutrophobiaceae bacterium]
MPTAPYARLADRKILLGISGGIAAYKSAELVRALRRAGANVQVVMTDAACRFITPLTLSALSGNPVHTDLLDLDAKASSMAHIDLARWAELILVAPASANLLARLSHGSANDLLSATILAADCPVHLAPAMNRLMWKNSITQENAAHLRTHGLIFHDPGTGDQACGEWGEGRMQEPAELLSALDAHCADRGLLRGLRLTITAGPTHEPIDPVRYISNRSSGRMGYALANCAQQMNATVCLVSGHTHLPLPSGVDLQRVKTAEEMYAAVMEEIDNTDIFIAAAAVADYTCPENATRKIKKDSKTLRLSLTKTRDILAAVAKHSSAPFTVGFAAETHDLKDYAMRKLKEKRLDMIAANYVEENLGMETLDNALTVLWDGGECEFSIMPKPQLAHGLLHLVAQRYRQSRIEKL